MGLFGDKTEVEVHLDTPEVVAGQAVVAHVRLGAPDKKAQAARVELLYRNTYTYDSTDSEGDTTTATATVDVVVATVPLGAEGDLRAGDTRVELEVPWLAPGTAHKSIEWVVRAVVDRRRGTDAKADAPLVVRAPAAPLESWAKTPPTSPSECAMAFDVPDRLVRPGDTVSGSVTVTPASEISARALKVRLRRVRYDKDGNSDVGVAHEVVAGEGIDLSPGQSHTVPFALTVPPDAPPSFQAEHNQQCWYVEAVFDRKLRGDVEGRLAVLVHNA